MAAVLDAADAAGPAMRRARPRPPRPGHQRPVARPPDAIDPAFGGDSRAAHAWLASSAGAAFVEVAGDLELDLDTPDDLLLAGEIAARPRNEPVPDSQPVRELDPMPDPQPIRDASLASDPASRVTQR